MLHQDETDEDAPLEATGVPLYIQRRMERNRQAEIDAELAAAQRKLVMLLVWWMVVHFGRQCCREKTHIGSISVMHNDFGGFVQDCGNSIANALELPQFYTKLSETQ